MSLQTRIAFPPVLPASVVKPLALSNEVNYWSATDKLRLVELIKEGHTLKELAALFKRSERAVNMARYRLLGRKCENRRWSEEELGLIAQMTKDGHTPKEIAQRLGRTEKAVFKKRWVFWGNKRQGYALSVGRSGFVFARLPC